MTQASTQVPACTWMGASGRRYEYSVFSLPVSLQPDQTGNYVYAKRGPRGDWLPVYIGEGDLADRSSTAHHKAECIRNKGATHFHCHLNPNPQTRREEEADLLARYRNAFEPDGCNEVVPGGRRVPG